MRSILFVSSARDERKRLAAALRLENDCVVFEAESMTAAVKILEAEEVSLLVYDISLFPKDGFELLRQAHRLSPETAVIIGAPHEDRQTAVEVMRQGAFCHLSIPYDLNEVVITAARGLQQHDMLVHRAQQGRKIRKSDGCHGIIGVSEPMRRLFEVIEKVAEDDHSTVLIQGETGTGKELVARAIHARGPRQGKNFVPVNCAAIPDDLLESELFGYIKGAFTGANTSKIGRVQFADGGTLFLDEIGDMKPSLQAKLLRVLQEKQFEPLGGVKPVSVDVRVIAATHRNLEKAVEDGTFREDLYYRLSVIPLLIPPLRERREDIRLLIDKFVQVFNRNRRNAFLGFDAKALETLVDYAWPGNVRELENLVQRMAILYAGVLASVRDLPEKYVAHLEQASLATTETRSALPAFSELQLLQQGGRVDFNALIDEYENRLILQALEASGGNKKDAALLLGLNRTTLLEKIKKKQLETGTAPRRFQ